MRVCFDGYLPILLLLALPWALSVVGWILFWCWEKQATAWRNLYEETYESQRSKLNREQSMNNIREV